MLPGLSIVGFLLATTAAAGGGGGGGGGGSSYSVTLSNETISKVNTDGTAATASFTFRTDRSVRDQDGGILDSAWVSSGATVANYSIRVTVLTGNTPTGTMNTWLALSSNRTWSFTDAAGAAGSKTGTMKVEIKDNASGVILDSATYTMTADSQAAGAPTTYNPVAGNYSNADYDGALYVVSASASVPWTWSYTGNVPTSTVASGNSATSIQFSLSATTVDKESVITLQSGGKTWTITLQAYANAGDTAPCVVFDTPVQMSDPSSSGVIEIAAGDVAPGVYVYTMHEDTLEWGSFEVLSNEIVEDQEVLAIVLEGRRVRATPAHRFYVDGKWQSITALGGVADGTASVVKMRVKDAHTYSHPPVTPDAKPVVSHNIKL